MINWDNMTKDEIQYMIDECDRIEAKNSPTRNVTETRRISRQIRE